MKEIIVPVSAVFRKENIKSASPRQSENGWMLVLFFSTAAGVLFQLTGLTMSGLAYFVLTENSEAVNRTGTWLMAAAFPLMILGAHALDKIKEKEVTRR